MYFSPRFLTLSSTPFKAHFSPQTGRSEIAERNHTICRRKEAIFRTSHLKDGRKQAAKAIRRVDNRKIAHKRFFLASPRNTQQMEAGVRQSLKDAPFWTESSTRTAATLQIKTPSYTAGDTCRTLLHNGWLKGSTVLTRVSRDCEVTLWMIKINETINWRLRSEPALQKVTWMNGLAANCVCFSHNSSFFRKSPVSSPIVCLLYNIFNKYFHWWLLVKSTCGMLKHFLKFFSIYLCSSLFTLFRHDAVLSVVFIALVNMCNSLSVVKNSNLHCESKNQDLQLRQMLTDCHNCFTGKLIGELCKTNWS